MESVWESRKKGDAWSLIWTQISKFTTNEPKSTCFLNPKPTLIVQIFVPASSLSPVITFPLCKKSVNPKPPSICRSLLRDASRVRPAHPACRARRRRAGRQARERHVSVAERQGPACLDCTYAARCTSRLCTTGARVYARTHRQSADARDQTGSVSIRSSVARSSCVARRSSVARRCTEDCSKDPASREDVQKMAPKDPASRSLSAVCRDRKGVSGRQEVPESQEAPWLQDVGNPARQSTRTSTAFNPKVGARTMSWRSD